MKQKVRTIALCTVLGLLPVGCQKEDFHESGSIVASVETTRSVEYTVDGEIYQIEVKGDAAWQTFLSHMVGLTKEGKEVTIVDKNKDRTVFSSKEVVTYTTATEKDAVAWCDKMFDAGYKVTMTYDTKNNQFVCIAIK